MKWFYFHSLTVIVVELEYLISGITYVIKSNRCTLTWNAVYRGRLPIMCLTLTSDFWQKKLKQLEVYSENIRLFSQNGLHVGLILLNHQYLYTSELVCKVISQNAWVLATHKFYTHSDGNSMSVEVEKFYLHSLQPYMCSHIHGHLMALGQNYILKVAEWPNNCWQQLPTVN